MEKRFVGRLKSGEFQARQIVLSTSCVLCNGSCRVFCCC